MVRSGRAKQAHPSVLITGASSGIGAAFARRLAGYGVDVTLVARRRDRLEALAESLELRGARCHVIAADLATDGGVEEVVAAIERRAPTLLVNAAGFGTRRFFVDLPAERLEAMARLHVMAPLRLTRAALPAMIARGAGGVIMVSSLAAFFTTSRYTTYSATKAFLNQLSEGLQVELQGTGVSVQALCPGLTRTGFFDPDDQEGFDYPGVPGWVWLSPDEVVEASLSRLGGSRVVVVPGTLNRSLVWLLRRGAIRWTVDRLMAGRANAEDRPW
jgi:uncharacterized protein